MAIHVFAIIVMTAATFIFWRNAFDEYRIQKKLTGLFWLAILLSVIDGYGAIVIGYDFYIKYWTT